MICPKCQHKLINTTDEARACDGRPVTDPTPVLRCFVCGYRKYLTHDPVVPMTAAMKVKQQRDFVGPYPNKSQINLVRKFYNDIVRLRSGKKPVSWQTISNLIRQATGVAIKGETIMRNYQAIEDGANGLQ